MGRRVGGRGGGGTPHARVSRDELTFRISHYKGETGGGVCGEKALGGRAGPPQGRAQWAGRGEGGGGGGGGGWRKRRGGGGSQLSTSKLTPGGEGRAQGPAGRPGSGAARIPCAWPRAAARRWRRATPPAGPTWLSVADLRTNNSVADLGAKREEGRGGRAMAPRGRRRSGVLGSPASVPQGPARRRTPQPSPRWRLTERDLGDLT